MEKVPRLNNRVTCEDAGTPEFLAPSGTLGTFLIQALGDNTDKIALGGEPDIALPDEQREHEGPISAAATQNAPLFDPGYSLIFEGDLGTMWVDVRVADEGVCWLRLK